uniref:methionyl-tRNA formyltransferase n=1 Tax=Ndongobacter massiliensis TaxID=1871025 RepID=UPI00093010DE|nr:methionyl-tRNA formyltransferase [Ndongobacter massiliensis]
MKIIFLGSPEFAVPSLRALAEANDIEVSLVVSQPDRQRTRRKTTPTPVKACAESLGIPVITPEKINRKEVFAQLEAVGADALVVIAYGQIIGKTLLSLFPNRILNIHGSILPAYRGAAPIQWALLDGRKETGLTSMLINSEMDAGDILDTRTLAIKPEEEVQSLTERLSHLAAELVLDTLRNFEQRVAHRRKQPTEGVTYAPKIDKKDSLLDFHKKGEELVNQVRALAPAPGVRFFVRSKYSNADYRVHRARSVVTQLDREPGTVLFAEPSGIAIVCGDGTFVVEVIQATNRRAMPVADFLRGHDFPIGVVLNTEKGQ